MGFDYEKVEKVWFKPKKDIIKVNLDLKGVKNLENYITDLEQSRHVLDELEEWLKEQRDYYYEYPYYSDFYAYGNKCDDVLDKIQELKRSVDNK